MTASDSPPAGGIDSPIALDDVFEILRNQRRRLMLQYLTAHQGDVALSELADWIAVREYDERLEELSTDERRSVYVGLYQYHLPKMAELGVVEFDREGNVVSARKAVEQFEPYIAPEDEPEPQWSHLYPRLVGGGWVLIALSVLGGGSSGLTLGRVALLVAAVVGFCALCQLAIERRDAEPDDAGSDYDRVVQTRKA